MKFLFSTAAIAALICVPATASAQLFGGLDNNTVLGGTVGSGLGAVIGSQIAPSGNRTEGSAIGAVVGGLAGASFGNSRSNFAGNPFAGQFNPGFNGQNLAGSAIGAGLGGVIGSNLAGSGQRQEGTAIGAVLGGLAGYSIANGRSNARYGGSPGFNPSFAPQAQFPGQFQQPVQGQYLTVPTQNVAFGGGFQPAGGFQTLPAQGPTYTQGGFVSGPVIPVTTYSAPRVQYVQPQVIRQVIKRERVVVDQPCPHGTTQQSDGSCLTAPRVVHAPAPTVIPSQCPSGTTDQGNGTCLAPAKQIVEPAPVVIRAQCPSGTTDLGNGTCQEPAKTILGSAPVVINQPCPSGTTDMGNGTCEAPARIVEQAPIYVQPQVIERCPAGTVLDQGVCISNAPATIIPDTIVTPEAYCYGNGKRMYDGSGRVIPGFQHESKSCAHH